MSETLSGARTKSTCGKCKHTIHTVMLGGKPTAVDPEVIAVVPSDACGSTVSAPRALTGRRIHAELCDGYQEQTRRETTKRELRAFNKRQSQKGAL